jgi:hypothetical protein
MTCSSHFGSRALEFEDSVCNCYWKCGLRVSTCCGGMVNILLYLNKKDKTKSINTKIAKNLE